MAGYKAMAGWKAMPVRKLVSSLSAFTNIETKKPWKNASPAYHEEEISGKGVGLVATRRIAAGELVLARTPAVLVDNEAFTELGEGSLTRLLVQAIEALPQQHQSEYLKLTTHDEVQSHDERIYKVFAKNNYRTKIANTSDFHATFIDAQLQTNWGFACTCKHCTGKEDDISTSDERMERIHSLWKELDDYTAASTATPAKAEELVSLYEEEGLKTRIHEAYYRAAIEYNAVGASAKASRFAMLSILRGQMMAGFDRPFVEKMKELVKDPEKHWSWKFRPQEHVIDEL
ncbi:SET domain-containing protein 5 [Gnomoniopsis sp. IMI 355080]|nr:SET domain-containing protein 5 [Gnomoniopsis sp. IMI 355080]